MAILTDTALYGVVQTAGALKDVSQVWNSRRSGVRVGFFRARMHRRVAVHRLVEALVHKLLAAVLVAPRTHGVAVERAAGGVVHRTSLHL